MIVNILRALQETAKGHVREACFKECAAYAEPEMCLAKMFFPYSISSASKIPNLPSVHGVPEDIRGYFEKDICIVFTYPSFELN